MRRVGQFELNPDLMERLEGIRQQRGLADSTEVLAQAIDLLEEITRIAPGPTMWLIDPWGHTFRLMALEQYT